MQNRTFCNGVGGWITGLQTRRLLIRRLCNDVGGRIAGLQTHS